MVCQIPGLLCASAALSALPPRPPARAPPRSPAPTNRLCRPPPLHPVGPGIIDSPTREIALALYAGGLKPGLLLQVLDKLPAAVGGACSVEQLSVTFAGGGTDAPTAEGTLAGSVLSAPLRFSLKSALRAETDCRMRETYVQATLFDRTVREARVAGARASASSPHARALTRRLAPPQTGPCALSAQVGMPSGLQLSRSLMLTYLDDDLLVIRDETGAAEVLERVLGPIVDEAAEFVPMVVPTPPGEFSPMDLPSDLE